MKLALGPLVCSGSLISEQAYWQNKIFDGQIIGKLITPVAKNVVTDALLQDASLKLQTSQNHHGRIWGLCPDGSGWIASMPAATPLVANGKSFALNAQQIKSFCKEFRIDFAAAKGGMPRQLRAAQPSKGDNQIKINTDLLGEGTLSVTCTPKSPEWQGPVMWYFAPVAGGPPTEVASSQKLGKAPIEKDLTDWINIVRKQEKLSALSNNLAVTQAATTLSNKFQIIHDRKAMLAAKTSLDKSKINFIGENRVQGRDAKQMIWLLWNSPRHRTLLLTKRADKIGISLQKRGNQNLAVIVLAN